MYQYIVRNARGGINTNQSVVNALNAQSGIESTITGLEIVPVAEANKCFAIVFNQELAAKSFLATYPRLGTLDLSDAAHPKILLNHDESFTYLFSTILKTEELLTNPLVPPFARVNFLERFVIQALEPFIFHGPRQEEMRVGVSPIRFKEGKLQVTLRGQMPGHSNTVISYNDFDALALICFTDAAMAANLPALKHLLHSVRTQYILSHFRGSDLDQRLSLHPLKIREVAIDAIRKRLFIDVATEKSLPGTIEEIVEFKQLLQQAFGDQVSIISSLRWGKATLEVVPNGRYQFNEADIALMAGLFQQKADVCFSAATKSRLVAQVRLDELKQLESQDDEVRYSFTEIDELSQAFRDSVSYDIFRDPLVVDNSGISFSSTTIQMLIDSGNRTNPETRQPMAAVFRDNKLLNALKAHYSKVPGHIFPPMLEGITTAVILPSGETREKANVIELFTKQNSIAPEAIQPGTTATLEDGSTITWADVWPNRAVQHIVNFYNQPLRLNRDERVLLHANPMVSLAATVSSLLESPAALSKEEAERIMESNPEALPIHVIWSSAPAGLRLSFKSPELDRLVLNLLTRNSIAAVSTDAMSPYKKCIFLSGDSEDGKANIKKFLFDICKYNPEGKYFDKCFTSAEFRYDSGPRAQERRGANSAAAGEAAAASGSESLRHEQLIFNFLRAMYYGSIADVDAHYAALPVALKRGYLSRGDSYSSGGGGALDRLASGPISAHISAAPYVATAYTPFALFAHVAGISSAPAVVPPLASADPVSLVSASSPGAALAGFFGSVPPIPLGVGFHYMGLTAASPTLGELPTLPVGLGGLGAPLLGAGTGGPGSSSSLTLTMPTLPVAPAGTSAVALAPASGVSSGVSSDATAAPPVSALVTAAAASASGGSDPSSAPVVTAPAVSAGLHSQGFFAPSLVTRPADTVPAAHDQLPDTTATASL